MGVCKRRRVWWPDLTVGNILAGYVTADVVSGPTSVFPGQPGYPFMEWNILIGHSYLVNLPAGSATGFNAVGIEASGVFGLPGATFASLATGKPTYAALGIRQCSRLVSWILGSIGLGVLRSRDQ